MTDSLYTIMAEFLDCPKDLIRLIILKNLHGYPEEQKNCLVTCQRVYRCFTTKERQILLNQMWQKQQAFIQQQKTPIIKSPVLAYKTIARG